MDTLQPYQPSLRDRLAWLVAGGAGKLGAGRYAQQDIASKVGGLLDFVPGVGDRGTVRFSDHPQPTEGNQIVGGYSSTLGRRHQPATYSVSPSEMTIDDVMGLYGYNPNGAR